MDRTGWSRERVLAFLWLVGSALTVATILLPYDAQVDETGRWMVAALALATGLWLAVAPPLPEWMVHGVLLLGIATIAFCTALGVPDIEGVFFLLPVTYAFATFPPLRAFPYLVAAGIAYAVSLNVADSQDTVAPWVAWTLVMGVAFTLGVSVVMLVQSRDRAWQLGRRDRRIAAVLQRTLLPGRLPSPPGLLIDASYVPATEEADVGGDLYDVIELPGGAVLLAIGDVAGKGLGAAATVGRVRGALRAYALDDRDPASVLKRLDGLLASARDGARMTTLLLAVVEADRRAVRWSAAGHPSPLLVPATGTARFLPGACGPPLGVRAPARFPVSELELEPGDRILFFTDGLVERRDESLDAGLERLLASVARTNGSVEGLLENALAVRGAALDDDVAMLAIEVTGSTDRLEFDLQCRPDALADMRAAMRRWLEGRCEKEEADDIVLACSEAATNAIMHGSVSARDVVRVEARVHEDRLVLCVHDSGRWRPEGNGDHGRGLDLIRALVDRVDVRRDDRGTTVELERRVGV